MSAEVESMFYVRETPWHGLGTKVKEAPSSKEALQLAGLDWGVTQALLYTGGREVEGYKANVRDFDGKVLGVVSGRYKVIQNHEVFPLRMPCWGKGYGTKRQAPCLEGNVYGSLRGCRWSTCS